MHNPCPTRQPACTFAPAQTDWLITTPTQTAAVFRSANPNEIVLTSGLIARTFHLAPNFATAASPRLSRTTVSDITDGPLGG